MEDIPGQEQDIYRKLCSIRDRFMSEKTHSRSTVDSSWKVVNSLVKDLFKLRSESEDRILNPVDLVIEDLVPLFLQFWSSCDAVSKDLFPIYVKAAKHLHQLNQSKISGLFTIQELTDRQTSLREISLHAKALYSMEGDTNTQGISMVCDKLLKCGSILLMTDSLLQSLQNEFDGISSVLKPIHDKLVAIKRELNLLICRKSPHAYSLAEVQLLQNELGEIEMARIDGKYISTDGNVVQGQASVIDLLEACFDDVHELLASRDEITGKNPLRPVYESLINIRSRLDNMNFSSTWGVRSHELNVLQAELGEIDNLRVDGKFMDAEGNCPIGQAILHFQLHKVCSWVLMVVL